MSLAAACGRAERCLLCHTCLKGPAQAGRPCLRFSRPPTSPAPLLFGACSKRAVSMLSECRSVDTYEKLNRISEGTYGVVYRWAAGWLVVVVG